MSPSHESLSTTSSQRCRPFRGNREALGWALDAVARSVALAPLVFLSTAIVHLAKKEAGCPTEIPEGYMEAPECDGRVYGLRPSSLLTT